MQTRKILLYFLLTVIASVSISAQELSSHEWEDRLVLILTTENSKSLHQEQIRILQDNKEGLEERKLVIYSVMPDQYMKGVDAESWIKSTRLNDLYRQEGEEFEVLLIGLDGRVKLRQFGILSIEKLFATIDAMPMRRSEIRNEGR
jgi:hypothetical protein